MGSEKHGASLLFSHPYVVVLLVMQATSVWIIWHFWFTMEDFITGTSIACFGLAMTNAITVAWGQTVPPVFSRSRWTTQKGFSLPPLSCGNNIGKPGIPPGSNKQEYYHENQCAEIIHQGQRLLVFDPVKNHLTDTSQDQTEKGVYGSH
jgi:hypothetical protein